jgi:hypothetical protein
MNQTHNEKIMIGHIRHGDLVELKKILESLRKGDYYTKEEVRALLKKIVPEFQQDSLTPSINNEMIKVNAG